MTNHISLKHQYAEIKGLRKPIGMGRALKKERLELDGTHHRGIDDARNISKIFSKFWWVENKINWKFVIDSIVVYGYRQPT